MTALYRTKVSAEDLWEAFEYSPLTGALIRRKGRPQDVGKRAGGNTASHGYRAVQIKGQLLLEHAVIWCWVTGEWAPEGLEVDHKNRTRQDNSWNNLRIGTPGQNQANCTARSHNKLGIKGVRVTACGKYQARIKVKHVQKHLGNFDTIEEASAAYKAAALELHGDFACLT